MPITKQATVTFTVRKAEFDFQADELTITADVSGAGDSRRIVAKVPIAAPLKAAALAQVEGRLSAWIDAK